MNTIIVLSTLLTLSIAINIILVLYLRSLIAQLLFISENLGDLNEMTLNFIEHLAGVNELETYYGDDTLQHLLEHVMDYSQQLEMFSDVFSLTTAEEEQTEEDDDGKKEPDTDTAQAPQEND